MYRRTILGTAGLLMVIAVGCQPNTGARKKAEEMPAIPVSHPVQREVIDLADFTGRTDSPLSVDVRARVSGYLKGRFFKDGDYVKKGDKLFEIDPGPYQAQLDQALSQVKLNEASLELARTTYERDRTVAESQPGAVSIQQLDQDRATVREAQARVKAATASTKVYELNLGFTRINAPINGQISRAYLTEGNLVNQDQTLLTTIVSLDPMYVYFDVDEPTLIRIREAINKGELQPLADGSMKVRMGLQGEKELLHEGTINFVNNQVNPTTASITMRGKFDNPKPKDRPDGERLLSPGMFVRIRLPISKPKQRLLVIDRAIGSDQGLKYVYVLDADNKVQSRRITTGALQEDGLRVILKGLNPDDWVVVGGLPQIRARMEVRPDKLDAMPKMTMQPSGNTPPPPAPSRGKGNKQPSKARP